MIANPGGAVGREAYLDGKEVNLLRLASENQANRDLKAGRARSVVRWMLVDLALSTGLRVGEVVALTCGDVNAKRKSLRVVRLKKNARPETTGYVTRRATG